MVEKGSLEKIQNLVENNLLDVNAVIETRYFDDMFDFYRIDKMHLLSVAAACNQYEICEYLLSEGVDPNLIMYDTPQSPGSFGSFTARFFSIVLVMWVQRFIENCEIVA